MSVIVEGRGDKLNFRFGEKCFWAHGTSIGDFLKFSEFSFLFETNFLTYFSFQDKIMMIIIIMSSPVTGLDGLEGE
jgi:hypothetical protein